MTMIESRYDWAVQVLVAASNATDGPYDQGVCDATRFLSGWPPSPAFDDIYDRYLSMLPQALIARTAASRG